MGSRQNRARDAVMLAQAKSLRLTQLVESYTRVVADLQTTMAVTGSGFMRDALLAAQKHAQKRLVEANAELSLACTNAREVGIKSVLGTSLWAIDPEGTFAREVKP